MSVTYTRDQVATWFGKHTVAKAMGYLRKVSDLNWDGRTLRGTVEGSEFIPYRTEGSLLRQQPATSRTR
jgi:hypothetical protein